MLLRIQSVLAADRLSAARAALGESTWIDGRVTAGVQSARVKHNLQLPDDHPVARDLGHAIVGALEQNPLFVSAALPFRVFPPLFSRYQGGDAFGDHVDNAIRHVTGTPYRLRTDLSATLFMTDPEDYDGGELVIEDTYGAHPVKLPAGDMVLYPATSLHHVRPIERGTRLVAFFWIQSLVRDDGQRTLLFDLDSAIQRLAIDQPEHPSALELTGVYHNLLRRWAEL